MRFALVALLAIAACHREAPAKLDAYLGALAGADEATRRDAVRSWRIDEAAWQRLTTDPYRAAHADYARQFALAAPALVARLAHAGAISTRPHFAGDPRLTVGQARARWAQPVQAPSEIAELDGAPIDAVFVRDGDRWRVIVGIDAIVRERAAALDPTCAALFDALTPGTCADAAWVVAEAALRSDRPRFTRACAQATHLCR
jgi:hypothetical protein